MDHFFPKIAAAEDAPNYGPTASDDRCEVCSYFRATNDGAGYCERFSFEAEPQSVCDDFVAAGRMKSASASSIASRLKKMSRSSAFRRTAASGAAGAVSGGIVGGLNTGEEKAMQVLKGALIGGTVGSLIGASGPAYRNMLRREASAAAEPIRKDLVKVLQMHEEITDYTRRGKPLTQRRYEKLSKDMNKILDKYPGSNWYEKAQAMAEKMQETAGKYPRKSSKAERYGAPALSALVGGGLGFGLTHRSKEQEKYRRSKK